MLYRCRRSSCSCCSLSSRRPSASVVDTIWRAELALPDFTDLDFDFIRIVLVFDFHLIIFPLSPLKFEFEMSVGIEMRVPRLGGKTPDRWVRIDRCGIRIPNIHANDRVLKVNQLYSDYWWARSELPLFAGQGDPCLFLKGALFAELPSSNLIINDQEDRQTYLKMDSDIPGIYVMIW